MHHCAMLDGLKAIRSQHRIVYRAGRIDLRAPCQDTGGQAFFIEAVTGFSLLLDVGQIRWQQRQRHAQLIESKLDEC